MAAREDQSKAVVLHLALRFGRCVGVREDERLDVTIMAGAFATQSIDGPIASGGGDPSARVRGNAGLRPPFAGDDERFLNRLFRDIDVTEEADQGGDHSTGLLA